MNNEFSRREQRLASAKAHRLELMNARGEVDCSECGAAVEEARGNRNAQELEREKVRKDKGPICNACQASWRYSHHQDAEMVNAKKTYRFSDSNGDVEEIEADSEQDAWRQLAEMFGYDTVVALKHALTIKLLNSDDKLKCPECDEIRADVGQLQRHLMGAHNMSREIARGAAEGVKTPGYDNATAHTDTCDFCGKDYQCARIKHDVLKCPACGGPSTMIKKDS